MHVTYAFSLHSQNTVVIRRRWYINSHKKTVAEWQNPADGYFDFNVSYLAWNMHLYLEEIPQKSPMGIIEMFLWCSGSFLGIVPLSLTWLSDVHFSLCECGESDI